jgi:colanic acid/amylovoran biosynthesis glycosyltransferase
VRPQNPPSVPVPARVVQIVRAYPTLSQTFVRNEVAELRRQGMPVDVVALHAGDAGLDRDGALVLAEAFGDRAEQRAAAARLRRRHPVRWLRFRHAAWTLRSEAVEWRKLPVLAEHLVALGPVAVLHAQFAWNGAATAMALARILDVPWSVTLHANDIFSKRHNLDAKLADADVLVTVCDYNRRWLEDHHDIRRPLHQVVCGVELPPLVERTPTVDVVAVGRLVAKKGFDVLVDAAAQLPDVRVDIVGDGPLHDELAARIAALGIGDRVRLVGSMDHDATLDRIAAARVFCLPCRIAPDGDRDSMPVVIKEAMARRVPVVATDVVGVPEMVDDTCGALVPAEDPAALAAALAAVLADPARAAAMGDAGRRRVEERFTLAGEVAKLADLFRSMGADVATPEPVGAA